jgi:aminocarboxymuconate-semialdehyde decarboxylase
MSGGILFVGCRLADVAAQLPAGAPARRAPVLIRGRRIKTVDMHAHCVVPQALALLNRQVNRSRAADGWRGTRRRPKTMDAGIDTAVVSLVPNWHDVDRGLAERHHDPERDLPRLFDHADRFAALASVALQFPTRRAQLERRSRRWDFEVDWHHGRRRRVGGYEIYLFWAKAEEPASWCSCIRSTRRIPRIDLPVAALSEK